MGELVDLKEYRLKKEAEKKARDEEEIEKLRVELAEVMARLSLSPDFNSIPVFIDEHQDTFSNSDYYYLSTIWPGPLYESSRDSREEYRHEDYEDSYSNYYEDPKWYIDLRNPVPPPPDDE